jgi:hypothetical protein
VKLAFELLFLQSYKDLLRTCRSGTMTNSHINSCTLRARFSNKHFRNLFKAFVVASRSFNGGGLRSNDSGFNISYKVGIKVSGNSNRICCRIKRKSSRDRRTVTMDCRSPCYNRYICQYLPFVGEPRSTTLDLPFHILLYTQLCLHPVSLRV